MQVIASMQRDVMPGMSRMAEADDLPLLHAILLQVLDRGQEPTVKEIARIIDRSVSRTSRLLDQLVRRGLAERYEDPHDRRLRRARPTEAGAALLRRMRAVRVQSQMELLDQLTEDEQDTVIDALELFAKAARSIRDARDSAS